MSGVKGRVSTVVLGVVLVVGSGRVILPPTTLTHLMLGCVTSFASMVTLQMRERFCPASVKPAVVMDTTGSGRAEGVQYRGAGSGQYLYTVSHL